MSDTGKIIAGLVVFLVLVTFPIWYALASGEEAWPRDLELPTDGSKCVEDTEWMIANHMDLLNQWRDAVIRDGEKEYTSTTGETYAMSLTGTCMKCHPNRETFCYRCHSYANVQSLTPLSKGATAQRARGGVGC